MFQTLFKFKWKSETSFAWKLSVLIFEHSETYDTFFLQPVTCVDVSPGDSFFACGTKDSAVKVYDLSTGKVRTF